MLVLTAALLAGGLAPLAQAGRDLPNLVAAPAAAPSLRPDRIVPNPTQHSTTAQTITWRTSRGQRPAGAVVAQHRQPVGFKTITRTGTSQIIDSALGYRQAFHNANHHPGWNQNPLLVPRGVGVGQWSARMPFTTLEARRPAHLADRDG